jgi:hypothetical protein
MFCLTGFYPSNSRGWAKVREEFDLDRFSFSTAFWNTVWRCIYKVPQVSHDEQVIRMMEYAPRFLTEYWVNEDNAHRSKLRACLLIVERSCHYLLIKNDKMAVNLQNTLQSIKRLLESPTSKVRRSLRPPRRRDTQRGNQTLNASSTTEDENTKEIMKEIQKTIDLIEKLLEAGDDEGDTIVNGKKMEVTKVSLEKAIVTTVPSVGIFHGIEETLVDD